MKNILFIGLCLLMVFSLYSTSAAADITISGSSQFDSSLLANYMKKHGYSFVGESQSEYYSSTNTFAASNAEIVIKDATDTIVGKGISDEKGNFSITVPRKEVYKVIVRFHGHEVEQVVKFPETEDIIVNLGYFSSDTVGGWIQTAALRR
jgi:hypothetical protein